MYNCSSYYYHKADTDSIAVDSMAVTIEGDALLGTEDETVDAGADGDANADGMERKGDGGKPVDARRPTYDDVYF